MKNVTTLDPNTPVNYAGDTVNRHIAAFLDNDLDGVIADYASNATLVTPDASFQGPAAIKDFFKGLMPHFPKGKSSFVLDKITERGTMVYILWHGQSATIEVPFATDTFILSEGKIYQQTFAAQFQFVS